MLGALPPGMGQQAIARRYANRLRHGRALQRVNGAPLELQLEDATQAKAFLTRRYEPETFKAVCDLLPWGGLFVDVGAHVGLMCLSVLWRRPDIKVYAYEPHPANNSQLWRNARLVRRMRPGADPLVDRIAVASFLAEQVAVTDRNGHANIYEGTDSGTHSLNPDGELEVETVTLARNAWERIDVLKIDTEGSELAVLQGAETLLADGTIRAVVCEINPAAGTHHNQVAQYLGRYGFEPRHIPGVGLQRLRRVRSENALFVRAASGPAGR